MIIKVEKLHKITGEFQGAAPIKAYVGWLF